MMIVSVPLPCELNASIVAGLNTAPSELPASGRLARILPSSALRMTHIAGSRQQAKRMRFFTSSARPAGVLALLLKS